VPIRVHADPSGLTERNAGAIGNALVAATRRALNNSRAQVLETLGGPVQVRFAAPTVRWTGERAGEVGTAARFAIERALKAAVIHAIGLSGLKTFSRPAPLPRSRAVGEPFDKARYDRASGTYTVPSYNNPPAPGDGHKRPLPVQKKEADRGWRLLVSANFRITPAHFFDVYDTIDTSSSDDRRTLHAEVLDTPHTATAWVVEVLRESEKQAFADHVHTAFHATRPASEVVYGLYGFGGMRRQFSRLAEDHVLDAKVPEFESSGFLQERETADASNPQQVLVPGAWLLLVFLPLPRVVLEDIVKFGDPLNTTLTLKDVSGLVVEKEFSHSLHVDWSEALHYAGDTRCDVLAEKFTVRRKIPQRTLDLLFRQRREQQGGIGQALPLTDAALAPLAPGLKTFLQPLRDERSPPPAADGWWPAGARGANVTAAFVDDLQMRVLAAKNAATLTAEADRVAALLKLSDGFWSDDRTDGLEKFIDRWEHADPRLFELLLDELARRGLLDAFLEAVRTLPGWVDTIRRRDVLNLASQTKYARDPRIVALTTIVERAAASVQHFHYDVEAQEIWIDGDANKRVRAAGNSTDAKRGVVAEADAFYSESARVRQLGPQLLERLREPTRKKIGEMMARMICASGETLTREQMLAKAMQEAAAELNPAPEEKDFIKVTLQQSIRVLKLEHRVERGVTETYITFQDVRRFGDGEWEPSAEPRELEAYAFEQRLEVYRAKRMVDLLGTLVLAESVLLGGLVVIEVAAVSVGVLLVFVGVRLLIYRFTTDTEDRTIDGYLVAALQGELDALGFKLLGGVTKWGVQAVVGRALTRELIGEVGAKWISFGLRGTLTAVGFGFMGVGELFAKDLLRLGNCEKWSGAEQYWDKFKTGFIMGLAMEFVAIPLLAPPARALLERAGSAFDAARALFSSGKALRDLEDPLLEATEHAEEALARTIGKEAAVGPMTRGFRKRVGEVLVALAREYQSRAYASLLELYGPELSSLAARGLRRLLGVASEREIDALLKRLLESKVAPSTLLGALGDLDGTVLAQLAKSGQLETLASSPRVIAWLTRSAEAASVALRGPFKESVSRLEAYLSRLEVLTPAARQSVLDAIGTAYSLSPDLMLAAAGEVGTLDAPTLDLLKRSVDSEIKVGKLFDGSGGASLREYAEGFGKLSRPEQDYALQLARGRPPDQVLATAARTQAQLKEVAAEIEPTPQALRAEVAAGTRARARDLVISRLRNAGVYQTAILDTALIRQARQLAAIRKELLAFSPDAFLGVERSGPFLAESAAGGEQSLRSRIVSIADPKNAGRTLNIAMADMRARIEAMIAQGKRRFAFTEVMMSGSAVNKLQNDVMIPLARLRPDVEFRGYYLREGLNYEARASASGVDILQTPADVPNLRNKAFDVSFILGDDAPRIIQGTGTEPLYIYDSEGNIVETLRPRPGETTRDMMIRILTERGGG